MIEFERLPVAWNAGYSEGLAPLSFDASANRAEIRAAIMARLRRDGFVLLAGLAADGGRETAADRLLWIADVLGRIVMQSPRGERIEDVRDFSDVEAEDRRGYRSRGALTPHTDPSDLIALHCLRAARSGGESHLVSLRSVCERLASQAPDLLDTLFEPFPQWRPVGVDGADEGPAPDRRPVLARHAGGVSCMYYRPFIEKAAAAGAPLCARQRAALDAFDAACAAPQLGLRFFLREGQTLLLHNRTVLHARTDYEDWPEPGRRRHLLRAWLEIPDLMPVAQVHRFRDPFAGAGTRGGAG